MHSHGICHCDIKPENVCMVSPAKRLVKIIDFGSAVLPHDARNSYVQSRWYRAPEVMLGLPWGVKADIWSVGCLLAELLLGSPLFYGSTSESVLAAQAAVLGPHPDSLLNAAPSNTVLLFFTPKRAIYTLNPPTLAPGAYELKSREISLAELLKCPDKGMMGFMEHLLDYRESSRPLASAALRHPWLESKRRAKPVPEPEVEDRRPSISVPPSPYKEDNYAPVVQHVVHAPTPPKELELRSVGSNGSSGGSSSGGCCGGGEPVDSVPAWVTSSQTSTCTASSISDSFSATRGGSFSSYPASSSEAGGSASASSPLPLAVTSSLNGDPSRLLLGAASPGRSPLAAHIAARTAGSASSSGAGTSHSFHGSTRPLAAELGPLSSAPLSSSMSARGDQEKGAQPPRPNSAAATSPPSAVLSKARRGLFAGPDSSQPPPPKTPPKSGGLGSFMRRKNSKG